MKALISFVALLCCFCALAKPPVQSRGIDYIDMKSFLIPIDDDPLWNWSIKKGDSMPEVFEAVSPEYYYPKAIIQAQHFVEETVPEHPMAFNAFSMGVIESIAKNFGVSEQSVGKLVSVSLGEMEGFRSTFTTGLNEYRKDMTVWVGRSPDNTMFLFMAFTEPGKMAHLQPVLDRTWKNIRFPSSLKTDA
ncbi:hypothetical protein [Pleionea sp. CnH1-48]|uniref:hypothetical protein n=1 Tax=Pleionea sp. CnH1-48 TaxID=2954494 RepID=UPI002096BA40|nr:hypothetical protein [Pleionea sp. CnH1-48]MCO7223830.1 hypothetical protein [Pleionea sp. CnH1-48]